MSAKTFEQIIGKKPTVDKVLTFEEVIAGNRGDFSEAVIEPNQDDPKGWAEDVLNWATVLQVPYSVVAENYDWLKSWDKADPRDVAVDELWAKGEIPQNLGDYQNIMSIEAAPEEVGLLGKLFGYRGAPKPEHYWDMNRIEKAAFDTYMAGGHILDRIGGKVATELGLRTKKEVMDLYEHELVENPKWYQKSPELVGWGAEKAAEFYALKGIFKATGLHRLLTLTGQKLSAPFISKAIVTRGGMKVLPSLSKEGLKRVTLDGIASFLRFAPENTAFLSSWAVSSAALKDEDKSEAAISGAIWGLGFSAILPIAGGLGRVALGTKIGQRGQRFFSEVYTNMWVKHPRIMNAGRRAFSDEFLAEAERQYKARFGIEPTAADRALLKKYTRVVGQEIQRAVQKDAAMRAYWESGKVAVKEAVPPEPPTPTEAIVKPPVAPPVGKVPIKPIKVPPKPTITETAKKQYDEVLKKAENEGLLALDDDEFEAFLNNNNVIPDNIDRHEAGFVDFAPIIEAFEGAHDWILTFGEVKRTNPELYDKLMKSFAERSAAAERAISEVEQTVVENIQISQADNAQLSLTYEDKRLSLPEELSEYAELFERASLLLDRIEQLSLKEGIFAKPFQERMIKELTEKREALRTKLKHPAVSKKIQELTHQITQLKSMRYLPHSIVARRVVEERLTTLTGERRKKFIDSLSRITSKFKKRKGKLFLRDYLVEGLISESDIGFTKLITESLADYYHRTSLKSLYDYAKEREYIKPTSPILKKEGWLNQREIGIISPELKDQLVHPVLASALAEMKDMRRGRVGSAREIMSMVKIGQFIKPTIIWVYNTVQKYMRGMYSLNPIREATSLARATKSVINKDALYHRLNASNLYQFPYEVSKASRQEQIKMFVRKHQKETNRLISLVERSLGTSLAKEDMTFQKAVKTMVTSAHRFVANTLTWTGDKIQRTQSYLILRKMGYPHDEAVKVASKSHVAYSTISHKFKKALSPIVFVYSFRMLAPIEMMKTLIEPMVGAGEYVFSAGKIKPPRHKLERWAKALAGTAIIPILVDTYMRAKDFEVEGKHLGPVAWKYKKIVEVDGKEREIVVGLNYILNMPVKYWNRLTYDNPISPDAGWQDALERVIKWEVHPVWRIFFWDIQQNQRSFGTGLHVYDPQASPIIQVGQTIKYCFGQGFRFWGGMMDAIGEGEMTEKERAEQEKIFDQALNKLDKVLFSVFGYKYVRLPLEERKSIAAAYLMKEFRSRAFEINRRYDDEERDKRLENLERWAEKCRNWIEQGMK